MIEAIGGWLVTVAGSAMLFGLFDMLLPKSSVRSFTRVVTGLVVMAIILSPLVRWAGRAAGPAVQPGAWFDGLQRSVQAPATSIDWDQARAMHDVGRQAAADEVKRRWEAELTARLAELSRVAQVALTSTWGPNGPTDVRVRLSLREANSADRSSGIRGIAEPRAVAPLRTRRETSDGRRPEFTGGRAPPETDSDIGPPSTDAERTGGTRSIAAAARRIVQATSGLSDDHIFVEVLLEE